MIHWLSARMSAHEGAIRMRRRSDKLITRMHLAHMARSLYLKPRQGPPRGIAAADILIARHHGRRQSPQRQQ